MSYNDDIAKCPNMLYEYYDHMTEEELIQDNSTRNFIYDGWLYCSPGFKSHNADGNGSNGEWFCIDYGDRSFDCVGKLYTNNLWKMRRSDSENTIRNLTSCEPVFLLDNVLHSWLLSVDDVRYRCERYGSDYGSDMFARTLYVFSEQQLLQIIDFNLGGIKYIKVDRGVIISDELCDFFRLKHPSISLLLSYV